MGKDEKNTSFFDWEQSLKPNKKKKEKENNISEEEYKKIIEKFRKSLPDEI